MIQASYDNFKKVLDSNEYNSAINTAKEIIKPFLTEDEIDFSDSNILIIDIVLPSILRDLFNIHNPPRKITNSIAEFVQDYISLIVKLDLREKLLRALCECIKPNKKNNNKLSPIQLSDEEQQTIINELENPKLCMTETENNLTPLLSLISNTINYCFKEGLFKTAIDKIISEENGEEKKITNIQLSLVFKLFSMIDGYLKKNVIFTMLPIFADAAIDSLTNISDDTEGMTIILTNFIDMIPDKSDRLLKILCEQISTGPINKRITAVKGIRSIVEKNNMSKKNVSKKNLEEVKSTLLDDSFDFTNSQFFDQVLDLFPVLSKEVRFTDDDLINIFQKVHSPSKKTYKCISEIIPNVKTDLKKFAQCFLESAVYSPDIIFSLISQINNKQMSNSLLSILLNPPNTDDNDPHSQDNSSSLISAINSSFNQISDMKSLLEYKMDETEDPAEICSLSQIILNAPNISHIDRFITKVIKLSEEYENLVPILESFSTILEKFDSESTITSLFNKAYDHFTKSKGLKYLDQILPVLAKWFDSAPSINVDYIIGKLMTIPFMKITAKFTPFVSSVIKLSSEKNSSRLNEFLLKILYDTVPMRFSSWAIIDNVFQYLHDDKKIMACVVKMLSYHLQGEKIPIELFDGIFPDKPSNINDSKSSSSNSTKTRISTRSRSRSSRNQRSRKRRFEYSDDESETESSDSETNDEDDEKETNDKKDSNYVDESVESKVTLRDIILAQNQSDSDHHKEEKMKNTIYLIERAAQYEADFFRIGEKTRVDEQYRNSFKIFVSEGESTFEFEIGLHPFHTCGRLFLEISKLKRIPINKFSLFLLEKSKKEGKLIKPSTPISEIVEVRIKKIRLKLVKGANNIIPDDFIIEPVFLNTLENDIESTKAMFDYLATEAAQTTSDEYENMIIIETLQLFEPFNCFTPISPLQKVLLRNYDHPLDFENHTHLFPLALAAYWQRSMNYSDFSKVIDLAINRTFDKFSAVIIMKAIMRIECNDFVFTPELIKKGLIQNKHKALRHALLHHFNRSSTVTSSPMMNSFDDIVSLIPLVAEPTYRENSKEFLACFKKCNLPKDCFVPFYKSLEQYETAKNFDQTFISLLQLIPKNEETIKLTYERISVAPTVKNPQNPFVHSEKTRKAAFKFLTTDQVYPILINHLSMLPEVPTSLKLSDDFTFKGRNGINNLGSTCYINTLMQSLNTATNFTNRILSFPTNGLSNYLNQLRDFMGQLRYARNPSISIKPLIDSINPDFDFFQQADTEEFLMELINLLMKELKEDAAPLIEELELTYETDTYQVGSNEKEGKTNTDRVIVLSLHTKDLTNLFDSFNDFFSDKFVENVTVESTQQKVTVVKKQRVSKWPNYLIIQLQRWDFNVETQERWKLVHEFFFPMEFSTGILSNITADSIKDDPIDYELSAILVHEGDIEIGHYFAIVNGDNSDWYMCDDNDVTNFDIANIPSQSFGRERLLNDTIKDNQVPTAYLLFYRRRDIQTYEPHMAPDFEERINRYNEQTWPSTWFFSNQFLSFTKELTASYPNNEFTTEVAFTCLFKISIVSDVTAAQWSDHIIQHFLKNAKQCQLLFSFIKEKIGKTLGQLVNLSDKSCECLKSVIFTAFKQLPTTTEPLITVLSSLDFAVRKRSITLACELASLACQELHVSWKNEEEALLMMVKYLTMEMGRDNILFSKIKNSLAESAEVLIKILSGVVVQRGVIEPIAIIFQNDILDRLHSILKQSESFKILATFALSLQPSLISSIDDASAELLMNASHKNFSDSSSSSSNSNSNSSSEKVGTLSINANLVCGILEKLCFNNKKNIRIMMCSTLCKVMDDPDLVVKNYINNRVFEKDLICPSIVEESTFLDMIASLLPIGLQNYNIEYFNEFSKVLVKLCIAAPFATSLSFSDIIAAVPLIPPKINKGKRFDDKIDSFNDDISNDYSDGYEDDDDESIGVDLLIRFMIVVKHLVAFNDELRDQVTPQIIDTFLSLESGREEALQFVALFHKQASGSPLFASCVSEALNRPFSDMSNKIIEMVSSGMSPGNFIVPEVTQDPNNIKIATALFQRQLEDNCEKQRDNLKNYILFILKNLKPVEALQLQPFAEAIQMIENHYQISLDKELLQ